MNLPDAGHLVAQSVTMCRNRGMSLTEATLIVYEVAKAAHQGLVEQGYDSPWLADVTKEAYVRYALASAYRPPSAE